MRTILAIRRQESYRLPHRRQVPAARRAVLNERGGSGMRQLRRSRGLLVIGLSAVLVLAACSSSGSKTSTGGGSSASFPASESMQAE